MVKLNYISNVKFIEQCEWAIDLLAYDSGDGNLYIPKYTDIEHLQPFQVGKFWNPILIHYTNNKNNKNNKIFCRVELISYYLSNILQHLKLDTFTLFTGHSDETINNNYIELLNSPRLIHWYANNIDISHNKLTPIPIGINGVVIDNINILDKLRLKPINKNNLYYVNIGIGAHAGSKERIKCLQYAQKKNRFGLSKDKYFKELSKSCFVLSPRGNGIDCHRHWESLYLQTIPVVTDSLLVRHWAKFFPLVILNDWSEFDPKILTPELYYQLWKQYPNIENDLNFDYFFEHYCL
jgi:hypothetical protein